MLQAVEKAFYPKYDLKRQDEDRINRIRQKAADLATEFHPTDGREKQLAMTKLEEAVMWAVKGISHGG
jgi:hypothetical protein